MDNHITLLAFHHNCLDHWITAICEGFQWTVVSEEYDNQYKEGCKCGKLEEMS